MKNVTELREQLSQVFNELRSNTIKHTDAAELANIAGKMINSAKVQLEYYALRKESPTISFLASEEAPLVKEAKGKKA
jgi:5-formyltetrahydrofolate cyclo-ligase